MSAWNRKPDKSQRAAKEQAPSDWQAAEAFALMWYACPCGHRERIWNSRRGVTPFCTGCPSCGEPKLRHADFHLDVRAPEHKPHRGQRVWIDLTIERAREYAARHVKRMAALGYPPPKGKTEDQLIEELAQHEYVSFGEGISPDLAIAGYDAFKDSDE